ncbi:MAG: hypothetical protein KKF57_09150, partial [Firmicutes bacterium]|nr:hypothetical protein [Bacillota bacterium]
MIMNKSFKLITTLLIIVFLSFQYSIALEEQKQPPSPEWSRSFPTDGRGTDYFKLQSVPTENGIGISRISFDRWDYVDCDMNLNCDQIWSKTDFNYRTQAWTDGDSTYYIKDETLFRSNNPNTGVPISSSVIDFTKSKDILVYWTADNKLVVQIDNQEPKEYVTEEPVWQSFIVEDQVFVVYKSVITNTVVINQAKETLTPFAQFKTKANENLHSMHLFALNANEYSILLEIGLKSAGARHKYIRTANISKTTPEDPVFSEITFVDKVSGEKLRDMNTPMIFNGQGTPYLTFTATMSTKTGSSNHIFVGELDPERIEASVVTKSGDFYSHPVMLNEETIVFYKKVKSNFEMMYSSANEEKRELSENGLKGDAMEAFHSLFTQSFKGILLALLSFLWIVPATFISYFIGNHLQKRGNPHVSPLIYGSYIATMFISQLLVFSQVLHADSIVSKMPYLSETWHLYLLLFIACVVSVLPLFLSRTKIIEDNANRAIVHATLLNLVILVILIGPYFF